MEKKLRHNDYYDDYDNEDEYHSPGLVPPRQSIPAPTQSIATPPVQEERQKPNYPKYCFV